MVPAIFRTTRLKRGNFFFPAVIEVTDQELIYIKRQWFILRKSSIRIREIASIHVKNCRFSSEFLIKRVNGGAPFLMKGIRRSDSDRIRGLVEKILGV